MGSMFLVAGVYFSRTGVYNARHTVCKHARQGGSDRRESQTITSSQESHPDWGAQCPNVTMPPSASKGPRSVLHGPLGARAFTCEAGFGRFDARRFGLLDARTFGRSDARAFGRSDVWMFGRLGVRTFGRSGVRTFGRLDFCKFARLVLLTFGRSRVWLFARRR